MTKLPYLSFGCRLSLGAFHFPRIEETCQWFILRDTLCTREGFYVFQKPFLMSVNQKNNLLVFLIDQTHMGLGQHKTPESFHLPYY